jgi:hypothetical protein
MRKTLLIAGALLLASASSAFAQGYNPYYGGRGYYGRQNAYTDYFRQLRACQRHERLHEELDAEHADEHYQGMESRGDHRDLHDAIDEAHDAYHDDHPRADYCDGLARSNPYGRTGGYQDDGYGYGYGYGPGYYRPNYGGMSFGFGFGR